MSSDNPLRVQKKLKIETLKSQGVDPYPHVFQKKHSAEDIIKNYSSLEAGEKAHDEFILAGRVMTKRDMGKASFFNIQDESGSLQIYLKSSELQSTDVISLTSEAQQVSFKNLDIGDFVGLYGKPFKTKKGELSLRAESFQILCKSVEPLPEKFHGLTDIELKYRYRYLDLLMNRESRKVFEKRSQIIKEIRSFLDKRGFLEVDTPVLQPIYGGAAATPFETHHQTLDMKLFLKISPELYLKRLIVGGFEKVYEIGKNFRNEGIDRSHNPEFTMLEYYEAYTDYNDQMCQFEELVSTVIKSIKGSYKIKYQGRDLDFTPPWKRLSVIEAVNQYASIDIEAMDEKEIFKLLKEEGSQIDPHLTKGHMIIEAFEIFVEKDLWQPVFVKDFPLSISPLTKKHRENKNLVERFEPIVAGMELGNAYTELNDPMDQLQRLQEQERLKDIDGEVQPMDKDFIHAIEVGMPPTGGVGLGIERLVMLITDQPSIRDILLFPTMKLKS